MKKKKGLIVAIFFGVIMTTSLAAGVMVRNTPPTDNGGVTITGTPADNFKDEERPQFCGTNSTKSNTFVKEYSIPTFCTNPLAIVTDHQGNVWFAETNTGKLGKFDPSTESFKEYDNSMWPKKGRSMIWGMDYSPDGSLWFTDETFDSVWKFSPDSKQYQRLPYPSNGDALPQKLKVDGSQIIVNDFTGNKITFLDLSNSEEGLKFISLPSPVNGSVTAGFALDAKNDVWYTNWIFQQGGVLVKFDQEGYKTNSAKSEGGSLPLFEFIDVTQLPPELLTPNGATFTNDGRLWLADTSSSSIFSFNPDNKIFTQYVTSDPPPSTYGNYSGLIKTPITRPYWVQTSDSGKIVFNEQTANRLAVMDPIAEKLVEYFVPSMNPNWADCGDMENCGVAQVFDFTINKEKIWFTEWVENNIGVLDMSIPLPLDIELDSNTIHLKPGESKEVSYVISPQSSNDLSNVSLTLKSASEFLSVNTDASLPKVFQLDFDAPRPIVTTVSASEEASPGIYKILLGANTDEVSIGKFLTVIIEP